jgi:hypothetical protein
MLQDMEAQNLNAALFFYTVYMSLGGDSGILTQNLVLELYHPSFAAGICFSDILAGAGLGP